MSEAILNYQSAGSGLPLVLLHGFPHDSRIWEAQSLGLAGRMCVITPDLSGFGKSLSDQPFTMASQAAAVHDLLTQLKALPCVLGGLSMGGYIAFEFLKQFPGDLLGLILLDTRADADSAEARQGRAKMIELVRTKGPAAVAEAMLPKQLSSDAPQTHPEVIQKLRSIMESQSAKSIENALAAMLERSDQTTHLPTITTPTLVLVGQADALTLPAVAEGMHQAIPQSRLAVIPGAGHVSCMEKPAEVTQSIADFVQKVAEKM